MAAAARVSLLESHLAGAAAAKVDDKAIFTYLFGDDNSDRDEAFRLFETDPLFKIDFNHTKEAMRQITRARLQRLVAKGFIKVRGSEAETMRARKIGEAISFFDASLSTLIGAQFVLFAGSILHLGSEFHHEKFLKRAETLELRGCFAMTELGHGSNVRGIETTAIFDAARDEWIINTPSESAQKYWIGGGFEHAEMATVFAQLYINQKHYGVHALLVPLRDEHGRILPGVRVKDCGHKMGLNGIDNGRFWFDHVRIPRENLLDRMGTVERDGSYNSIIEDNDMRFGASMANLVSGRVGISRGSTNVSMVGLATAILYAEQRRQFGPPGAETPIMDYVTHQARLMPLLATTYAHHFISTRAQNDHVAAQTDMDKMKQFHILISGLKALTSWHGSETLQTCREACGGMGFKTSNRIGALKADTDIQLTYEGDNFVLLQQVSKMLLKSSNPADLAALRGDRELAGRIDLAHIRSAEFQLRAFRLRAADLNDRVNADYSAAKKSGMNPGDAFQTCSMLATDAGRAYIEAIVLEEFVKRENEAPANIRPVLGLLRALYALSRMDGAPSFLRGQYFTREKTVAIARATLQLCAEVRVHATPLVRAFGLPDFLLGDIAQDYISINAYNAPDRP